MLYTPLLPEAASGTLEPRHVVVPLRQMCPHAELVLGRATSLDVGASTVRPTRSPGRPRSPTTGSWWHSARSTASFPCQGSSSTAAASRISPTRSPSATTSSSGWRLPRRAARASELGFVFVGAGYAGVEALAELNDLARAALRYYPACATYPSGGCSSMRLRRSCPRSRAGSERTPLASSSAAGSRSTSARRWRRTTARPPSSPTAPPCHPHARLDGRCEGLAAAARLRVAARRPWARAGRRDPPGRGPRGRLVARRLRRGAQHPHPGHDRSADLPARLAPGAPAREEPERADRGPTATACSARSRHSAATRASRT